MHMILGYLNIDGLKCGHKSEENYAYNKITN